MEIFSAEVYDLGHETWKANSSYYFRWTLSLRETRSKLLCGGKEKLL